MLKLAHNPSKRNPLSLLKTPSYSLRTRQSDPVYPDSLRALPQSSIRNPRFYHYPHLVLPLKTPIFPRSSYFTLQHPVLKSLLDSSKLHYLVTCMIKNEENAESWGISVQEAANLDLGGKTTENTSEHSAINNQNVKLATDDPASKELIEKELFEDYHENVIYDEEINKMEPRLTLKKVKSLEDLYSVGTLCRVSAANEVSQNGNLMVIKGVQRVKLLKEIPFKEFHPKLLDYADYLKFATVSPLNDLEEPLTANYKEKLSKFFELYANLKSKVPQLILNPLYNPTDPRTIDILCGYLCQTSFFKRNELQKLLEILSPSQRLDLCYEMFSKYGKRIMAEWSELAKTIKSVENPDNKSKMLEIYNFLKKTRESPIKSPLIEKLVSQISQRQFPEHIKALVEDELNQIQELHEQHPDFNTKRNLLELILSLPFGVTTQDTYDLEKAAETLNEEHFGMDDVKERILEFIAVSKVKGTVRGKSLLLVGPPGVGKTSIASSIAKCLNRKFARISLGGEHDVAVIKGHRKTYLGSYPGKIVQALKSVQSENPVILLDEVDKIGRSIRGNIQDALLEVLDPVQNNKFYDNYLEVPLDLSKVLFVCSANLLETVHPALLDRMEIIEISGYTQQEKTHIVSKHLLPKALQTVGLEQDRIAFTPETIEKLINGYARESGLRNLERYIKRILEKTSLQIVMGKNVNKEIMPEQLVDFIGLPVFSDKKLYQGPPQAGIVIGLAYNAYGGSILFM